jgi:F420-dependent oxidoreductase-like protein
MPGRKERPRRQRVTFERRCPSLPGPPFRQPASTLDIATTAESSGFDTVLVMDHLHQIRGVGPPENWMLEGDTVLPALAARTQQVNVSLLVGAVSYRNPALHAKITTTLDVISGGRAIHGIGAGWNEEEATAYGYDFPPLRERFERLEDHLNIARAMFTEERATYEGTHHSVRDAYNNPKPIRGDIPIMIGGSGEKKTLRMVAQYADASNFFGDAERIRHLVGVLEGHCERLGRDPAEITKTRLGTVIVRQSQDEAEALFERIREATGLPAERLATWLVGDPDTVAEQAQELLDAGLDGLIFNLPDVHDLESVRLLGQTLGPLCSTFPSGRSSVG